MRCVYVWAGGAMAPPGPRPHRSPCLQAAGASLALPLLRPVSPQPTPPRALDPPACVGSKVKGGHRARRRVPRAGPCQRLHAGGLVRGPRGRGARGAPLQRRAPGGDGRGAGALRLSCVCGGGLACEGVRMGLYLAGVLPFGCLTWPQRLPGATSAAERGARRGSSSTSRCCSCHRTHLTPYHHPPDTVPPST